MDQAQNLPVFNQWINDIWTRVEPYYQVIKKASIIFLVVFNICCVSLCISAFFFGTIYFYHMPTIQHTFPLHFHFNRSCMQQHKIVEKGLRWDRHLLSAYTNECFPVAHVDLSYPTNAMLLQEGQSYSVLMKIELPETPENLNMGMFMVNMVVQGVSSSSINIGEYRWSKRRGVKEVEKPITYSASKPLMMRYKSPLLRHGFTLLFWPLLMFDFVHESQVLDEMLFENIMLEQKSYNWTASVYLENPGIEVYSANLDVVAKFSGIQYLLYRWPVVSFVFGTFTFFVPTVFVCAVLFYYFIWRIFFRPAPQNQNVPNGNAPPRRYENQPPIEIHPVEDIPARQEDTGNEPEPNSEPDVEPDRSSRTSSTTSISRDPSSNQSNSSPLEPSSVTENIPSISSEHSTATPFSVPSSSEFAPVPYTSLPAERRSRRSSSSSSIEMISPPSTFSNLDDEEIDAVSAQPAPVGDNFRLTEGATNDEIDQSDVLDQGLRRRVME